jgi:hypothetical protein
MNNEPVAWMDKESNITMIGGIYPKKLEQYLSVLESRIIALESHSAKTLTDEEIEECFEESCTDFKLLENGKTKGVVNIIDVGRAILRKAQEK